MYRRQFIRACLAGPLFACGLTLAHANITNLPLAGTITEVSFGAGIIFVDDVPYKFRSSVRVVDASGKQRGKLKRRELDKGVYIEFAANDDEPTRQITVLAFPNF